MIPFTVPVTPGGDEARRWLVDELAKAPYQAARPNLFDLVAQAIVTFFADLFTAKGSSAPDVLLIVGLLVLVAIVVTALLLFGLPSRNRRSTGAGSLFGDEDRRTADDLRRAAAAARKAGDWSLAVLEGFRAVARGLDERTVVAVFPGTTATGFAQAAAGAFEAERGALAGAATAFDGVRYGGGEGTREQADEIAALDARLAAARPRLPEPVGA